MRTPNPSFLTDTVLILPLSSDLDDSGAPNWDDPGLGIQLMAAIQRPRLSQTSRPNPVAFGGAAFNAEGLYDAIFGEDPHISAPGQRILWLAHKTNGRDEYFQSPIVFTSRSGSEPPSGLSGRWTVSIARVTGS